MLVESQNQPAQWYGELRCAIKIAQNIFVRKGLSHSRECLKPGYESSGKPYDTLP